MGRRMSRLRLRRLDASLAVAGYTYTVTGPDNKPYATLAAAVTANPDFDATSNGYNATSDTSRRRSLLWFIIQRML